MMTGSVPRGPGLFRTAHRGRAVPGDQHPPARPGTEREPGSVLVTAGMVLLAVLATAGLLYVVFAAQDRFIFRRQAAERGVGDPGPRPGRRNDHFLGAGARPRPERSASRRGAGPDRRARPTASAFMNWTASEPGERAQRGRVRLRADPAGPGDRPG